MANYAKLLTGAALAVPLSLLGPASAGASAQLPHTPGAGYDFAAPIIEPGGVVNGVDYSASDIHPGTVISIFGQWFLPADTVVVTDGGTQITISAGSPWWYDSGGQINATLPTSLAPGQATVMVVTSAGKQSNEATITINP